jgi:hypothetical protein
MLSKKILRLRKYSFFKFQKQNFSHNPFGNLAQLFFPNLFWKKEDPDKFDFNDPITSLAIKEQKRIDRFNELGLDKQYDKIYDVLDRHSQSKSKDLSFIKLDKHGVPLINQCYYETLGVKKNSNKKQIKGNYYRIALLFHPDKNEKTLVVNFFEKKAFFTHVCNAYETLMDEQKRAMYDDDMQNFDKSFYITIWKFKINVLYVFL